MAPVRKTDGVIVFSAVVVASIAIVYFLEDKTIDQVGSSFDSAEESRNSKGRTDIVNLERGLAKARSAIRKAANSINKSNGIAEIYRHPEAFYQSYMEMEKRFKIYVYEEGEIMMGRAKAFTRVKDDSNTRWSMETTASGQEIPRLLMFISCPSVSHRWSSTCTSLTHMMPVHSKFLYLIM